MAWHGVDLILQLYFCINCKHDGQNDTERLFHGLQNLRIILCAKTNPYTITTDASIMKRNTMGHTPEFRNGPTSTSTWKTILLPIEDKRYRVKRRSKIPKVNCNVVSN
jgi:hypothetical protein